MGLLDNLAIAGAGAGLGMITGERERMNAAEMNAENIRQQMASAKQMTVFNREQQMKMWRDTNYSKQVDEMKKAGLSVGLMYGQGGGGGTSTNVATSQGASGQAGAGRNDIQAGMGIMLQNALLDAQRKNIEADTVNKQADTVNKGANTEGQVLENEWNAFLQNAQANNGQSPKEVRYRVDTEKVRSEISKVDEELKAIPQYLQNDTARVKNDAQRIIIEAQNAETAEERNAITERIAQLDRNLRLLMQGNQLNEDAKNQGATQRRHEDVMEQKDQDQLMDSIEGLFSTAIPWYERRRPETTTTQGSNERGDYESTTVRRR